MTKPTFCVHADKMYCNLTHTFLESAAVKQLLHPEGRKVILGGAGHSEQEDIFSGFGMVK